MEIGAETLDLLLGALEEQVRILGGRHEIVVIGGSALAALGLVRRVTKDVDLLALADRGELRSADPLPDTLREARDRVARDFGLDPDWLNAGPTDRLKWGLPHGFVDRLSARKYGSALTVHFASRLDQVHFKLFAIVDQAGGRHETDLRALQPNRQELVAAARWSMTQDPSPGYMMVLIEALAALGVEDANLDS